MTRSAVTVSTWLPRPALKRTCSPAHPTAVTSPSHHRPRWNTHTGSQGSYSAGSSTLARRPGSTAGVAGLLTDGLQGGRLQQLKEGCHHQGSRLVWPLLALPDHGLPPHQVGSVPGPHIQVVPQVHLQVLDQ